MKATAHDGIIKNSDLEKVREAREVNAWIIASGM
jgi:hypothetical protein